MRCTLFTLALIAILTSCRADERTEFFEARVRPLLVEHCHKCHSRKSEGGLRVDSRVALAKGGSHGPAVVPGKPNESLIWQVITGNHDEISMPPEHPLSSEQTNIIKRWIAEGAVWSESAPSRAPDEHGITESERMFWAFQPLKKPAVPRRSPDEHPIDAFVRARYRDRHLSAASPASASVLFRRLAYDLTGLPPGQAAQQEFVSLHSSNPKTAIADAIEQFLSSDEYGERWGQHWLDLVRYADTAGDASDYPIPEAWKYRNWVIDAFNKDKPYDSFVQEQIAGDLLPATDERASWQQQIATGYLAISRRVGVSPRGKPHIVIEDTLDNLGKTFLGLTVGCARCHDHKFDPIPTADYYRLYGIFDSTVYPHPGQEHHPYREDFVFRVGRERANAILASKWPQLRQLRLEERALFEKYREFQKKPVDRPGYNRDIAWERVLGKRDQIRQLVETFPNLQTAYAVSEGEPHDVTIQEQGDPRSKGPLVDRGFLQVLGGQTLQDSEKNQSGRLQLAKWLTQNASFLTARVIVNRIWHHHFGTGLVATPSDFGVRGAKPTHPLLLDYLAGYLIARKWSLKSVHRHILMSETWQLSSNESDLMHDRDPSNQYLWRANRRRLDAEQLRDTVLQLSGRLDREPGQRHPVPHRLTYFFRQHEPYVGRFQSNKRSVYLFRQRIRKNEFLDQFDGPDGNLHLGQRRNTTTALQALYFLNSDFVESQSQRIAERILNEVTGGSREQVDQFYSRLYGRQALPQEQTAVREAVERLKSDGATEPKAWSSVVQAMLASNEFLFVD